VPHLAHLRVPSWGGTVDRSNSRVNVFCDASERAYVAALYIRSCTVDNNVVHLACSKNRFAPVKKVTLPGLGFLAALVELDCCTTLVKLRASILLRLPYGLTRPYSWAGYGWARIDGRTLYVTG